MRIHCHSIFAAKVKFYPDLSHALLGRRIISDVDGSYPERGFQPA